jgi:hypothetical protein
MVKKISAIFGLLLSASILSAEINFDNGKPVDVKGEIEKTSLEIPSPEMILEKGTSKEDKEWTVMVYMNAKNNLEQFGIQDVNEMEMVGSSDKVNIVVEFGRLKGYDSSNGDWTGVRRYYITKDNDTSKINSTMVQDLGEVDMGNYKNLADFIKWTKANYPAKKYMLIVWNHGSGWEKGVKPVVLKGISYDDVSGNHINTPQLGMALKEGGKVDVYGSDACLMQMAEVIYEIKDYATYIVGSEETEPGDGYTYNDFLAPLIANPTMEPADLAKTAVDAYINHYKQTGDDSTQSYIRASNIDDFLNKVNEFAYSVTQAGDKKIVKDAVSKAQTYAIDDNKDLYHFTQLIVNSTNNADVKAKGQALMDFIKNKLVAYSKYTGSNYTNSNGVAIYLPSHFSSSYNELQWAKYSNWDEFINWYNK